jgi:hypothetical protein
VYACGAACLNSDGEVQALNAERPPGGVAALLSVCLGRA